MEKEFIDYKNTIKYMYRHDPAICYFWLIVFYQLLLFVVVYEKLYNSVYIYRHDLIYYFKTRIYGWFYTFRLWCYGYYVSNGRVAIHHEALDRYNKAHGTNLTYKEWINK